MVVRARDGLAHQIDSPPDEATGRTSTTRKWGAGTQQRPSGFFLFGGVLAILMRIQLAVPENDFLPADLYNQVFTLHGSVMMFLFAVPIFEAASMVLRP